VIRPGPDDRLRGTKRQATADAFRGAAWTPSKTSSHVGRRDVVDGELCAAGRRCWRVLWREATAGATKSTDARPLSHGYTVRDTSARFLGDDSEFPSQFLAADASGSWPNHDEGRVLEP
jgi:hypothetical protein